MSDPPVGNHATLAIIRSLPKFNHASKHLGALIEFLLTSHEVTGNSLLENFSSKKARARNFLIQNWPKVALKLKYSNRDKPNYNKSINPKKSHSMSYFYMSYIFSGRDLCYLGSFDIYKVVDKCLTILNRTRRKGLKDVPIKKKIFFSIWSTKTIEIL